MLHDGTYRQFDLDRLQRTKDSKSDFFEVILNFLTAIGIALMCKTGIGSPLVTMILTAVLGGLLWRTYSTRQTKLNNIAKNPNNAYHKLKSKGLEVTDDLQSIHKYKSYATFARIGYLTLLLIFSLFGSTMNLLAVQIFSIFFIALVLADLLFSLGALGYRMKRCGDMFKNQQ